MKRYLLKLLVFLLPLVTIIIFISVKRYPLDEIRLSNTFQFEINSYNWVNKIDSVQGFIMGPSTLKYGLSSAALKNCDSNWINFSEKARDPITHFYLLKKYLLLKHPKYILVGLDSWMYSKRYYKWLSKNSVMYLDLDAIETFNMIGLDNLVVIEKFKSSPFFMNSLSKLFFNSNSFTPPYNVVVPYDNGSENLKNKAVEFDDPYKDVFELNKYHWSELEFSYLQKIKEFCQQQHVKLIFIIPPKRNDFIDATLKKFAEENRQWWEQINAVIGGEYIIGSYSALSSYNQDSIFVDKVHLNVNGKAIFSNMVRKQLIAPKQITMYYPFIIDSNVSK